MEGVAMMESIHLNLSSVPLGAVSIPGSAVRHETAVVTGSLRFDCDRGEDDSDFVVTIDTAGYFVAGGHSIEVRFAAGSIGQPSIAFNNPAAHAAQSARPFGCRVVVTNTTFAGSVVHIRGTLHRNILVRDQFFSLLQLHLVAVVQR
jgi:hypothetical protein